MILESGYATTTLAKSANNCFGMKKMLSGNTWSSVWDGKSVVLIDTQEWDGKKFITIKAEFRKYPFVEDSIKDHSGYLLGAMNGSKKRYDGLLKCKNYKEAITLIKNGGYATDPNYISKICSIIQRFNLDRYDGEIAPKEAVVKKTTYYVQCGLFKSKTNANTLARRIQNAGFRADVVTVGSQYRVTSNQSKNGENYATKVNAEKRAAELKKKGFAALVKEA